MENEIQGIFNAVLEGNTGRIEDLMQKALKAKIAPSDILNKGMIAAMGEVGDRFERGEYYVPEMLIAARAMNRGLSILKPHLQESEVVSKGKVVIGTVKGDLHDIGKNLVGIMLEGAGFELIDLGNDVSAQEFVEAVRENKADVVAMSALLTTTMSGMEVVINALDEVGMRDQVKIMVGGAPITDDYASEIGADGFAPDASRAVKLARELLS